MNTEVQCFGGFSLQAGHCELYYGLSGGTNLFN